MAVTNNNWFHSESITNKWLKIIFHMDTKHINWITTFRLQMRVLFLHVIQTMWIGKSFVQKLTAGCGIGAGAGGKYCDCGCGGGGKYSGV